MSTTETGREAESIAARYLEKNGYTVLAQNWRSRWCEIDIVATKSDTVYFFEVKYRKSASWGDGLDAITYKKQQQMQFAAEYWIHENRWKGSSLLGAISMTNVPPQIEALIILD